MSLLTIWAPGCINPVSLYHSQSEPKKRPSSQATLSGAGDLPQAFPLSLDVIEVHGQEAWASALHEVEAAGICGLDLETTGLDPPKKRILKSCLRLAALLLGISFSIAGWPGRGIFWRTGS